MVHHEWSLGEAIFQSHPACRFLREQMLDYAEKNLFGVSRQTGKNYLCAYINARNPDFNNLVRSRGYKMEPDRTRPVYI